MGDNLYSRIREILDSARSHVARSVNSTQVAANWLIGREIVEEEQKGQRRANYGVGLMKELSRRLTRDYGRGFSLSLLKDIRTFYLTYPTLLNVEGTLGKGPALHGLSLGGKIKSGKGHAPRGLFTGAKTVRSIAEFSGGVSAMIESSGRVQRGAWTPGLLHPSLSWTHYRALLRVDNAAARSFYEIEAIKQAWPARGLERQINSLLYERLALSKDKKGLLRLAARGQEVQKPADVFKDPMVMEFVGLPESPKLVETDLEQALIDNLQAFLLEMGKGFAFVARQERITTVDTNFTCPVSRT
jgi:predicted nuclease of restriction endonuclease-like (RecB) superfamily